MEGRHEARKAERENSLVASWNLAAMVGAAFGGKLRPLSHYLNAVKPDKSRGGAALLGALQAMQRKGVRMTIERVKG